MTDSQFLVLIIVLSLQGYYLLDMINESTKKIVAAIEKAKS